MAIVLRCSCTLQNIARFIPQYTHEVLIPLRSYAVKGLGKIGGKIGVKGSGGPKKKIDLPVEGDVKKLIMNCSGLNYMKEGPEVKLKEDHEYPEWLWKLNTERPTASLEGLDEDSDIYWYRVRKYAKAQQRAEMKRFKRFIK
ncbi:39S ribosomal protein L54, mitochondrial isoform X2 [Lingula anatina]|uniref:Large ribosomal subunit protein mL54 n=1 Tax=Lingula anatina TaxID=7574 RepID=A0A1S3JBY9_LINAN|nr:39S ribosomal protein L54, mitochondrial-like [Lingula anatina]XP_013407701.1 39S ribosomal protein L54, mitochondrial isoform X2 [Lingula anatina]|eukprot:XP_013407228.1 39S ribosomal protein L54, mitochondrial-like [Lingula anatina]